MFADTMESEQNLNSQILHQAKFKDKNCWLSPKLDVFRTGQSLQSNVSIDIAYMLSTLFSLYDNLIVVKD